MLKWSTLVMQNADSMTKRHSFKSIIRYVHYFTLHCMTSHDITLCYIAYHSITSHYITLIYIPYDIYICIQRWQQQLSNFQLTTSDDPDDLNPKSEFGDLFGTKIQPSIYVHLPSSPHCRWLKLTSNVDIVSTIQMVSNFL